MYKKENSLNYQKYDEVPYEVERLLALSLKNFEGHKLRDVLCPRCHICLDRVGIGTVGFLKTKCPKCKHEDILDLRYFRTEKKQNEPKIKPPPEFVPGIVNYLLKDKFL